MTVKYRVDVGAGLITSFNPENGERVSYAKTSGIVFKPDTPMLIDMSITDYCTYGCSFCYRSSTSRGNHASFKDVVKALNMCAELNVFEVVLGGGDPIEHPNFISILQYGKSLGLTMSFTTKNVYWLLMNNLTLSELVGAVGLSVSSLEDIERLVNARTYQRLGFEVVLHIIPAALNGLDYAEMLRGARGHGLKLLLLGFKHVGRGQHWDSDVISAANPLGVAKSFYGGSFAIDTMLASGHRASLQDQEHIRYDEGVDSLFIDATKGTFSISSYSSEAWPLEYSAVVKRFQSWGTE